MDKKPSNPFSLPGLFSSHDAMSFYSDPTSEDPDQIAKRVAEKLRSTQKENDEARLIREEFQKFEDKLVVPILKRSPSLLDFYGKERIDLIVRIVESFSNNKDETPTESHEEFEKMFEEIHNKIEKEKEKFARLFFTEYCLLENRLKRELGKERFDLYNEFLIGERSRLLKLYHLPEALFCEYKISPEDSDMALDTNTSVPKRIEAKNESVVMNQPSGDENNNLDGVSGFLMENLNGVIESEYEDGKERLGETFAAGYTSSFLERKSIEDLQFNMIPEAIQKKLSVGKTFAGPMPLLLFRWECKVLSKSTNPGLTEYLNDAKIVHSVATLHYFGGKYLGSSKHNFGSLLKLSANDELEKFIREVASQISQFTIGKAKWKYGKVQPGQENTEIKFEYPVIEGTITDLKYANSVHKNVQILLTPTYHVLFVGKNTKFDDKYLSQDFGTIPDSAPAVNKFHTISKNEVTTKNITDHLSSGSPDATIVELTDVPRMSKYDPNLFENLSNSSVFPVKGSDNDTMYMCCGFPGKICEQDLKRAFVMNPGVFFNLACLVGFGKLGNPLPDVQYFAQHIVRDSSVFKDLCCSIMGSTFLTNSHSKKIDDEFQALLAHLARFMNSLFHPNVGYCASFGTFGSTKLENLLKQYALEIVKDEEHSVRTKEKSKREKRKSLKKESFSKKKKEPIKLKKNYDDVPTVLKLISAVYYTSKDVEKWEKHLERLNNHVRATHEKVKKYVVPQKPKLNSNDWLDNTKNVCTEVLDLLGQCVEKLNKHGESPKMTTSQVVEKIRSKLIQTAGKENMSEKDVLKALAELKNPEDDIAPYAALPRNSGSGVSTFGESDEFPFRKVVGTHCSKSEGLILANKFVRWDNVMCASLFEKFALRDVLNWMNEEENYGCKRFRKCEKVKGFVKHCKAARKKEDFYFVSTNFK